jgi:hypothetical protein
MHGGNHCRVGDPRNEAFIDRRGCCDAQRVAVQTPFPKEVTSPKEADDRLLASLRNDAELDLPPLDIEYCIGRVALGKDGLAFAVLADAPALPDEGDLRTFGRSFPRTRNALLRLCSALVGSWRSIWVMVC